MDGAFDPNISQIFSFFYLFQNCEMLVFGPHFVASAMYYLPSPLREKSTQESWLKLFSVITEIMMSSASGHTGQFFSKHFPFFLNLNECIIQYEEIVNST